MTPRVKSTADDDRSWRVRPWAAMSGLCCILLLWNWTLTLALAIALVSGVGIYLGKERRLTFQWLTHRRAWKHHPSLWVALLSSAAMFSVTYGFIQIWQESDVPWLATGILLQGIGTLAVLFYLVWDRAHVRSSESGFRSDQSPQTRSFQDLLQDLTNADPVVRFVAIRHISGQTIAHSATAAAGDAMGETPVWTMVDIQHCLRLLEQREQEPIVQQAICEAIARLQWAGAKCPTGSSEPPRLSASSSVVTIPTLLRTRAKRPAYQNSAPQPAMSHQSVLSFRS